MQGMYGLEATPKGKGTRAALIPSGAQLLIGHACVQSANVFIDTITQGVLLDQPVGPRVC